MSEHKDDFKPVPFPADFPFHLMTMTHAHLNDTEKALQQAKALLTGSISDADLEKSKAIALRSIEEALSNHVPSLRHRIK